MKTQIPDVYWKSGSLSGSIHQFDYWQLGKNTWLHISSVNWVDKSLFQSFNYFSFFFSNCSTFCIFKNIFIFLCSHGLDTKFAIIIFVVKLKGRTRRLLPLMSQPGFVVQTDNKWHAAYAGRLANVYVNLATIPGWIKNRCWAGWMREIKCDNEAVWN